ncbi:hypothetical protein Sgly_2746 [Syntrophobotulus glycolicus DSM 8271]|uniref:DUF4367 domain-containing protein n=1 Tax=Syntrophobotulus glycolicus (strain DSM 8271 / FlGlyR) TaxID=645991 RepID=F0SXV8_SYNGF|nr:DUF4367 domain-containing protein [Syntrophobotulus glycolicus]ADY57019.1 hypothetical protein Sgly_2746 [Syntrophobotulus glycolicus DSM 8271]
MTVSHNPMDKNQLLEELAEIQIKLAMTSYAERDGQRLLQENEELRKDPFYQPTVEAKRKFKRMINQHYYKQKAKNILQIFSRNLNKTAVVFSLLIVLLLTSAFTVQAVRIKVLNLFISMEDKYTEIRLEDKGTIVGNDLLINWENAYAPAVIPEGYSISNLTNHQNLKSIEYTSKNGGIILFQQIDKNGSTNVDTENAEKVEKVTVQGREGLLVNKEGLITVIWSNDSYGFILHAQTADLGNKDVFQIAESVTWVK